MSPAPVGDGDIKRWKKLRQVVLLHHDKAPANTITSTVAMTAGHQLLRHLQYSSDGRILHH